MQWHKPVSPSWRSFKNMAADSILLITATQPRVAPPRGRASAIRRAMADYWALTKPEINLLITIATCTGFYLAVPGPLREFPGLRLVHTLLGTLLFASAAGPLNQYIQRQFDAHMRRPPRHPLPPAHLTLPAAF